MKAFYITIYLLFVFNINANPQRAKRDLHQVQRDLGILDIKYCHSRDRSVAGLNETVSWIESKVNKYYTKKYSESNSVLYETHRDISIPQFNFKIVNKSFEFNLTKLISESSRRSGDVMDPLPRYDNKNYSETIKLKIPIESVYKISWINNVFSIHYYDAKGFNGEETFSIHILEQETDLIQRTLNALCHLHKLLIPVKKETF